MITLIFYFSVILLIFLFSNSIINNFVNLRREFRFKAKYIINIIKYLKCNYDLKIVKLVNKLKVLIVIFVFAY